MKALITGISGFAGSHLAEFLLAKNNLAISGIELPGSRLDNIKHIKNRLKIYRCDIRNRPSLFKIIRDFKPGMIFHLAAQAFIPDSWDMPSDSLYTNIIGTLNILEAVRKADWPLRIQIACSSEEYGKVYKNEVPVRETSELRPLSPYAVGKVGQDMLGYQYSQSYGMFVVRTRAFNHLGPRMGEGFAASSFARQIAFIEKGLQEPVIQVGNLEAIRDFTDVRDVVRAYWLALKECKPGEAYNICSGRGYKIKEILDILLSFTKEHIEIKKDRNRLRPSEVAVLIGDNTKFCKQARWEPRISLEKTLRDILHYWRDNVKNE